MYHMNVCVRLYAILTPVLGEEEVTRSGLNVVA